jgi:hypothetical protein
VSTDHQNNWQVAYQAALLEVDPAKLPARIEQAYQAIQLHLEAARQNNAGDVEHQALADALANLRVLRREAGLPVTESAKQKPDSTTPNR